MCVVVICVLLLFGQSSLEASGKVKKPRAPEKRKAHARKTAAGGSGQEERVAAPDQLLQEFFEVCTYCKL